MNKRYTSLDEIRRACPTFFKPKGFHSRYDENVYYGCLFITSERRVPNEPRYYTVREIRDNDILTPVECSHMQCRYKYQALKELHAYAQEKGYTK